MTAAGRDRPAASGPARAIAAAALAAALLGVAGCAATPAADLVRVEADDSKKTVEMKTGQVLEIVMQAFPARNLTLSLGSVVTPTLEQTGRPSFHDDTFRDGYSGTGSYEAWRFRAVQPGRVDVRMDYRLPWQTTGEPTRSVTFDVLVR
jgi:predicted secreted protein